MKKFILFLPFLTRKIIGEIIFFIFVGFFFVVYFALGSIAIKISGYDWSGAIISLIIMVISFLLIKIISKKLR